MNLAPAARDVRPLTVEPDVMASIRSMQFHDAPEIARLHAAAMGNSTWALLGTRFLTTVYSSLTNQPRFLGFVYLEDHRIRGFIAGSTDPDAMMREVFRKAWFQLGVAALPHGLRPDVLWKLLQTPGYKRVSDRVSLPQPVSPESLFCSFEPELRGRRVSGAINKVLFDELLARGQKYVKITTETDNEGANRQLKSWGFVDCGHFRFYGKEMITYVLDLEASPRVDAVSRHPSVE